MQVVKQPEPLNVLFLCTGNSARSVMAECILNRLGMGKFRAFSAGSHPAGKVNPLALNILRKSNYDVTHPAFEVVGRVCDTRRSEARLRIHRLR